MCIRDRYTACAGPANIVNPAHAPFRDVLVPAPTITLETPFHNDLAPSALEIVAIAFDMPVYIAAGLGFKTCIRVFRRSTGYITVCSAMPAKAPATRLAVNDRFGGRLS